MKFFNSKFAGILFCISVLFPYISYSQSNINTNGTNSSAIQTAVPFLLITPDSRSGAMGEAGVATSPDVNANFWNPSKLAFLEGGQDYLSISYSPWLRSLVPDVSLSYVSYAHQLDDRNTIGASLRYFNLGSVDLRDNQQTPEGTYIPNEFSVDGSFARKFGDEFSLGLTLRYIHSSLSNVPFSGQQVKAGNAVAADISFFYKHQVEEFGDDALISIGSNISNIGTKISYTDNGTKYFLPTNWKLGVANTVNMDDYNQFTVTLDMNKLLVPTNGSDQSVPAGIFSSFSDTGLSGELQEISFSPGVEYWYNKMFALRAGYYYQNPNRGGLHYVTLGTGFKYDIFGFDFSYIAASQQNSPLANT
ncbi:MAG: type IX secretion system outer membrane channel protein PorV, partial [Mucilaginibacter sp.]